MNLRTLQRPNMYIYILLFYCTVQCTWSSIFIPSNRLHFNYLIQILFKTNANSTSPTPYLDTYGNSIERDDVRVRSQFVTGKLKSKRSQQNLQLQHKSKFFHFNTPDPSVICSTLCYIIQYSSILYIHRIPYTFGVNVKKCIFHFQVLSLHSY